ncbi:2-polyprenyl-6-methoxyphenol hydroxylase-like FAD-dependent oxidoreductase [Pedobacter cryoconitis]|uniref:Flavin-dependent monooxygenase n=1 Tax=Pedobacter cryoconitis TaxID=188932 RepID=A0A7W8YS65_9SPHI|nr:NAD(P)/FAD-dependent oxidoreductase [Pedobacter cryoconitis]MBB5620853.1 2-polyprenyl-6-methoxyphenol hydroxylase-like FAD-dependent oxidoreductase [Pedobacter cryoconitis]MBB5645925.1 2-polyprenyl-6-methoxyphenol hydroxylase-like FAD-dependent oxidoreductase [Pedobacter cryoconitis]
MEASKTINLLQNKEIAIVGGGPGGLTLARLLQLKGANVKVYERDCGKEARIQGAIVDLHFDSGLKVMEEADLMDAFKANYMPGADKYRMVDKDVNVLIDEHNQSSDAGFGDEHFRPEIDRGALRNMLIDALLPDTVAWDSQFVSMELVNESWELKFKNGTTATADIVIGAEGYRSKIRPYLTDIKALYSGATIIQGEIDYPEKVCPEIYALVNKANLIAMDNGKTIAVQPRGDGGLTFYASSLYPEDWIKNSGIDFSDSEQVYAYLVKYYEGWNPIFFTLFEACKHFVPRPLNYFPLDQNWDTKQNLTLIGDAAHLMPPSGEGVNTAMMDALDLSDCLTSGEFQNVQAAIAAYEKRMRTRATLLGKEALEGIKDFASPSEESIKKLIEQFSQNANL